jgi:hypothetical protein
MGRKKERPLLTEREALRRLLLAITRESKAVNHSINPYCVDEVTDGIAALNHDTERWQDIPDSDGPVKSKEQFGMAVTTLIRETLIARCNMDYKKAEGLSEELDSYMTSSDFLTTLNGTTFTKTFEPKAEGSGE